MSIGDGDYPWAQVEPDPRTSPGMIIQHASDCATHNAPALPSGKCDCGARTAKLEAALRDIRSKVHAHNRGGGLTKGLRETIREIADEALAN